MCVDVQTELKLKSTIIIIQHFINDYLAFYFSNSHDIRNEQFMDGFVYIWYACVHIHVHIIGSVLKLHFETLST